MKIGDYVRTNDGYINKIKKVNQWNALVDARDLFGEEINIANNEIIKSSPNIIDLIEIGDIVNYEQLNGGVVLNKKDDSIDTWSILPNSLKNEDIKSVITKEQLKNCMYKVGEE